MTVISHQPAGSGGPRSLRAIRDDELATNSQAVRDACRELIVGGARPSNTKVAVLSGRSISTVNREPYKGILRAARACFDLVAQGRTYEDAVALVGEYAEKEDAEDPANGDPVVVALLDRIERLEAEVLRRDGQLYHTLGIVGDLRRRLAWHREKVREMALHIEALTAAPLPSRAPRVWQEDLANAAVGEVFDDGERD